jgi:site-specific DNA-methyltransferase (adenine-specific)
MNGKTTNTFHSGILTGRISHAEASAQLKSLPDSSAHLVFLDPPFNLGKKYGRQRTADRKPVETYAAWLEGVALQSARVLAPGGALFLYHLPTWGLRIGALLQRHLEFRHWIAISMKNGFVRGNRLYPAHYCLLYFTKGTPAFFKRPRLPPELCRVCGKTVRDYGGYREIIESKGINLSDVWTDISPVRHKSTKTRRANELPLRMTNRILDIAGQRGKLFVDPFCGSGAAVVSAAAAGMQFVGSDLSLASCRLTAKRLTEFAQREKQDDR